MHKIIRKHWDHDTSSGQLIRAPHLGDRARRMSFDVVNLIDSEQEDLVTVLTKKDLEDDQPWGPLYWYHEKKEVGGDDGEGDEDPPEEDPPEYEYTLKRKMLLFHLTQPLRVNYSFPGNPNRYGEPTVRHKHGLDYWFQYVKFAPGFKIINDRERIHPDFGWEQPPERIQIRYAFNYLSGAYDPQKMCYAKLPDISYITSELLLERDVRNETEITGASIPNTHILSTDYMYQNLQYEEVQSPTIHGVLLMVFPYIPYVQYNVGVELDGVTEAYLWQNRRVLDR